MDGLSFSELFPLLTGALKQVVTGLIGAGIVGGSTIAFKRLRDKLIARRFRITGDYISSFEDAQLSGWIFADATLKQRGYHISGISELYADEPGEERVWALEGELHEGSMILGSYVGTTQHKRGMGTFSLEVRKERLEGYWSGYDTERRTMTYGKYVFVKKLDVSVRRFVQQDRHVVMSISAATLGHGYFGHPVEYTSQPDAVLLVAVERSTNAIVGFIAGKKLAKGGLLQEYKTLAERNMPLDLRDAERSGELGLIHTVAIERRSQGHGVGQKLLRECERALGQFGCKIFVTPAWRMRDKVNAGRLLAACQYKEFSELPLFWKENCDAGAFACPARAEDGCHCDLVFYKSIGHRYITHGRRHFSRLGLRNRGAV